MLPDSSMVSDFYNASTVLQGYEKIGCHAINVGQLDLSGGLPFLMKMKGGTEIPFISANLEDKETGALLFDPYIIIERNDLKYGVIGLTNLSDKSDSQVIQRDYLIEGDRYIDQLKNKVDFILLLVNSERPSYKKLHGYFPDADIIFTSGSTSLTRPSMQQVEKGPFVFSSGREGRYLNKVSLTMNLLNKPIINKSYLESRIKYLNRKLERFMDKYPNQNYKTVYRDQENILNIFEESRNEVKRIENILVKKNNYLEFENIPMGSSIIDEKSMLDFINDAITIRKKLKEVKKL